MKGHCSCAVLQRRATWDGSPGKPSPTPLTHPTSFTAHVETPPSGAFASRAGLFPDVSPLMPHGHETYAYESSGQQVCHTPESEATQSEIDHKLQILNQS